MMAAATAGSPPPSRNFATCGAKAARKAGLTARKSARTVARGAPRIMSSTAAAQPVRSLPAVQWKSRGRAAGSAAVSRKARQAAAAPGERHFAVGLGEEFLGPAAPESPLGLDRVGEQGAQPGGRHARVVAQHVGDEEPRPVRQPVRGPLALVGGAQVHDGADAERGHRAVACRVEFAQLPRAEEEALPHPAVTPERDASQVAQIDDGGGRNGPGGLHDALPLSLMNSRNS
ncbi:hypothetical protein SBADM41S_01828 [Streptomyces badius]